MANRFCPSCGRPQTDCSDQESCDTFVDQEKAHFEAVAKELRWREIIEDVGYYSTIQRDFAIEIARKYPNPPTK